MTFKPHLIATELHQSFNKKVANSSEDFAANCEAVLALTGFAKICLSPIYLKKEEIFDLSKSILRLKKITDSFPELVFKNDLKAMKRYYGFSDATEKILEFEGSILPCPIFRPDCVLTNQGLKILEFNNDSGCTNYSAGYFFGDLLGMIGASEDWGGEELDGQLQSSFRMNEMFTAYLKNLAGNKPLVFWDIPRSVPFQVKGREAYLAMFKGELPFVLWEVGAPAKAEIYLQKFFRYFSCNHFEKNSDQFLPYILEVLKNKPEQRSTLGFSSMIYDSKFNLALLHDPVVRKSLSSTDLQLIDLLIPKTWCLRNENSAPEDLLTNRNKYVLKRASSFQGRDVLVGPSSTQAEWESLYKEAVKNGNYIIQEYIGSALPEMPFFDNQQKLFFVQPQSSCLLFHYVEEDFSGVSVRLGIETGGVLSIIDHEKIFASVGVLA